MAKSLSERIAERVKKKKPSRNAQNRAAFLAVRLEIKQALDDGWSIKSIWETLTEEKKITFSYQSFRGYVNRLLLKQEVKTVQSEIDDNPKTSEKSNKRISQVKGFKFNSSPKKEDLL